jgi:hypothetical protein
MAEVGDKSMCGDQRRIGRDSNLGMRWTSIRVIRCRALVGLVLSGCMLLLACVMPAWASVQGREPQVRASFVAAGSEVDVGGTVGAGTPRGGGARSHWKAVLQQRVGSRWLARATGRLRAHGGVSGFSLAWSGATPGHRETMRVAITSGRRVIAQSAARSVASTSPVSVQSTLRSSTVLPSSSQIVSASGSPNGTMVVILAKNARVPSVGAALVIDPGAKLPSGLLGVVTAVSQSADGTSVTTKPGALEDAYSAFSAHIDGKLGELAEGSATAARTASRRARAAINLGIFDTSFGCDDPSAQKSITHDIDLSELEVHAEVDIPSPSDGFYGPYILFTIGGQPKFSLGVKFTGQATCHASATANIPIPDTPLLVEIGPDFTLTASGAVGAELEWTPRFFYGFSRGRGAPSNDWKSFHNGGHTNFTGDASLTLSLALETGLSLDGHFGLRGSLGPEITGSVAAQSSPPQTCLSVNADFAASLTAFANTFFKDYTFTIGSAKFGNVQLYHSCTSPTPTPPPTPVSTPAPPPTPQPPTIPASGPTLVYDGQTAIPPEESFEFAGDRSFNDWAQATGQPAEVQETLPSSLSGYRCVALLDNLSLAESETNALAAYIREGGTIVAIGEHAGPPYAEGDETLNHFAETLGVGLTLNADSYDEGNNVTTNIYPSPLTEDVTAIGDNWVSSINVSTSGSAQPLVGTAEGDATLVGEQPVGSGTFIMAGDSNIFTDDNEGFYEYDDNGQLVRNLCP